MLLKGAGAMYEVATFASIGFLQNLYLYFYKRSSLLAMTNDATSPPEIWMKIDFVTVS